MAKVPFCYAVLIWTNTPHLQEATMRSKTERKYLYFRYDKGKVVYSTIVCLLNFSKKGGRIVGVGISSIWL